MERLVSLRHALEKAFAPDTAVPGTASEGRPPSAGHCAAVSYLVWRELGGEMVSAMVQGQSHWFNRLRIGNVIVDVDLTGDQFGFAPISIAMAGKLYPGTRVRNYSDLKPETIQRAETLAGRAGIGRMD
ncbi:MAG: hypothetical protein KatS3mg054_0074 [Chloroflexus sp.]|nr:MAG: hypothetical protein KatS3mg054_0074 [Chloroflexus sp.]